MIISDLEHKKTIYLSKDEQILREVRGQGLFPPEFPAVAVEASVLAIAEGDKVAITNAIAYSLTVTINSFPTLLSR